MHKIYGCFIITLLFLSGCGESGGGAPTVQPTIARVTLAMQGTLPTGELSGIVVTLQLPAGVTPALAANGSVDSGVVKASGVLANNVDPVIPTLVNYIPANGTTQGTLTFGLACQPPDGFGIGEFATVTLNIAPSTTNFATLDLNSATGSPSSVTDFKVISSSSIDLATSAEVSSITVTFTVEAM